MRLLALVLLLGVGNCLANLCPSIPDLPHNGICDPYRNGTD